MVLMSDLIPIFAECILKYNLIVDINMNQPFLGSAQIEILPEYFFPDYQKTVDGQVYNLEDMRIMILTTTLIGNRLLTERYKK